MDVVEVFVEVDSVGCVWGGGGECKHEVRDCMCLGVQHPSTGVEAESRLLIPAGILRIPVFSVPVAFFSQDS